MPAIRCGLMQMSWLPSLKFHGFSQHKYWLDIQICDVKWIELVAGNRIIFCVLKWTSINWNVMSRSHSLKVLGNSFGGIWLVTLMVVRLKFWEFFPHEMKKTILHEMRVNHTWDEIKHWKTWKVSSESLKWNSSLCDITYGHDSSCKSVCSILSKTS